MAKAALMNPKRDLSLDRIKKALSSKYPCYVLITCSEPSKEGAMEIEMTYEGDECLSALLVENAGQVFDDRALQKPLL